MHNFDYELFLLPQTLALQATNSNLKEKLGRNAPDSSWSGVDPGFYMSDLHQLN